MKVRDLIKSLQEIPPDSEIYLEVIDQLYIDVNVVPITDKGETLAYCLTSEPKQLDLPIGDLLRE